MQRKAEPGEAGRCVGSSSSEEQGKEASWLTRERDESRIRRRTMGSREDFHGFDSKGRDWAFCVVDG